MRVLVTGSSGLLGAALLPLLRESGHEVMRLVRREPLAADEIRWSPRAGEVDRATLSGFDGVVHLAGEGIASGRWTAVRKERIRTSRVQGTRLLSQGLATCDAPPRVLVCASAIGFYGDRGEEAMDEGSPPGTGFLAETCRDWERSADPARRAGIRTVHARLGMILSPDGGALGRMLLPFRMGVGGVLGSGRQWMSWISRDDAAAAVVHALSDEALAGAANFVAPNPVTNREFTKALGRALGRPTFLPVPAFAARLAFGEMADELLLASTRVVPKRLTAAGFAFRHPEIEACLRQLLGGDGAS